MNRVLFLLCAVCLAAPAWAQPARPTIAQKTAAMRKLPGYFPLYWDEKAGKLWLEIERWNTEFLYVNSLPAGLGSNDVGLDRGQIGGSRVVRFDRSGPKVLLVQPNYAFRAISDNPYERRAVEEAFAQSVLWGFEVEAEEGSRALVEATGFYLRDAHHIIERLRGMQQGNYRLEASRSAFYLPRTRNFPQNTEVETTLTFTGDSPGGFVSLVAPSPDAITLREHHSFIELPGPGYEPRASDPRAGLFGIEYMDFATPIAEPIVKRYLARHRLQKRDPGAAVSEPVKPIVYYLDRGAPEPIRTALLEGARWWSQAFESAGYRNAFRVELLPEDADPMDVRYNLIQWVHRSTRGWSYGSVIADPRTGEIIKGQVTLGSLRVRQDFLIAEGLLAPYEAGRPAPGAMEDMALARLRQLSAHEVGHSLGLAHNFAASAHNRASVMDYPHPLIKPPLDLSDAYATGVGEWDKIAVTFSYSDLPAERRKRLLEDAASGGLIFISDSDARPQGGAHPSAHLWDNGPNAVDELSRILEIRAHVLARFSERNIREGAPLSTLADVLAPVYLLHRYQTEAGAKVLGGVFYTYALRGDGQTAVRVVAAGEQKRALEALLRTIQPDALALPDKLLDMIPPPAFDHERTRESFRTRTGPAFDPLAAAEAAANLTVELLLQPERGARLVQQHARDASIAGLGEVLDSVLSATWKARRLGGYRGEIQRVVDSVVLYHLMSLAANQSAATQVRAFAALKLGELKTWIGAQLKVAAAPALRAHYTFASSEISRFERDPKQTTVPRPAEAPPGQPIGCE